MKSWLKSIILLVFVFFSHSLVLNAQPGDPGGDPDVPLGGIELLIVAGALFGAKKWLSKNKKE